eukprot:12880020-Prorocentrum_lima.AAC.1
MGWLSGADERLRFLNGVPKTDSGKGYVDVLVFKRRLLHYILDQIVAKSALEDAQKSAIRDICGARLGAL